MPPDRLPVTRLGVLLSGRGSNFLAIHEAIDFGLTMPASAVTLAALVGAAAMACGTEGVPDLNGTAATSRSPASAARPTPPRLPAGERLRPEPGGR